MELETCCFVASALRNISGIPESVDSFCSKLIIKIVLEIEGQIKNGCHHFLTGLTSEPELWFAEAVLDLKRVHTEKDLQLHIVLPVQRHDAFAQEYLALFDRVIRQADTIIELQPQPDIDDEQIRMQYILCQARHMICINDGRNKPINDLIESACSRGLPVSIIKLNRRNKNDITVRNLTIVR
jgi:uncharacterized phage-like protein YoqJ